ncbi:MAG TPA: hypothetical protein PKC72_04110 [Chitinophagaceae bacterium]|nr:hypothetical protein [Chitinophagaceae bacterium]
MAQNINILNELNDLNSSLVNTGTANVYSVPEGYFENLAAVVLQRIKALGAKDSQDELSYLSPLLSGIPKVTPYKVPAEYFDHISDSIAAFISSEEMSVKDELKKLSPVLSGLKKEMPYSIPDGYFESLGVTTPKEKAKVVSLTHRKWFRYAAAAVVTGIIVLAGFMIFGNKTNEPGTKSLAKFEKDVKKMDETEKENLIDFIDAGLNGDESASIKADNKSDDIKELLKGISDEELNEFNKQTQDIENVLLTN